MLPLDFFKSIKGIAIVVGFILALLFIGYRSCNQTVKKVENENVEVNKVKAPTDDAYDANCVRVGGQQCPNKGK